MIKRKKVVLIFPIFPIDIRGYKYILSFHKEYDIYLLIAKTLENDCIFSDLSEKIKEKINIESRLPLNFPFNYFRSKKIRQEIKRINPDLVICRDIFLSNFLNKKMKKDKREYVLDFCDNFPEVLRTMFGFKGKVASLILEKIEKKSINLFDKIIFVSPESYDYVLLKHNIKKEKYILENVPFKIEKEKINYKRKKTKDLIYLGTMNKKIRDFETIFLGLKKLKMEDKKIYLDIYYFLSQDKLKNYYEELSKKLEINDLVRFHPAVKYEELNSLLLDYKIGLVPHTRSAATDYTIPNKIYDYMQIGLPVLASNNPSLENIIKKYKFGELYLGENQESFAEKVIELISKNTRVYSENGINGIKNKLNWEKQFKEIFDSKK